MKPIRLGTAERGELALLQRGRSAAMAQVRRARLMLLLEAGTSWSSIKGEQHCDSRFIATWSARLAEQRLVGLFARHGNRTPLPDFHARGSFGYCHR